MKSTVHPGYIALLSVLIVSAIAAAIVSMVFLTSINSTLNSGNAEEAMKAKAFAEACADLALQRVSDNWDPPCSNPTQLCGAKVIWNTGSLVGMCKVIDIYDDSGGSKTNWIIRTTGSGATNRVKKFIEIEAYRHDTGNPATGSAAIVNAWRECIDFSTSIGTDCPTE